MYCGVKCSHFLLQLDDDNAITKMAKEVCGVWRSVCVVIV